MLDSFSFLRKISLTVCSFINFASRRSADSLVVGPPVRNVTVTTFGGLMIRLREAVQQVRWAQKHDYRTTNQFPIPNCPELWDLLQWIEEMRQANGGEYEGAYTPPPRYLRALSIKGKNIQVRDGWFWQEKNPIAACDTHIPRNHRRRYHSTKQ